MNTLCNPALSYHGTRRPDTVASSNSCFWAVGCWRSLVFCTLFSVVFLPEFLHQGNDSASCFVYAKAAAGFRFVDLGILALVLLHLAAVACSRKEVMHLPRELVLPGLVFLLCIAAGIGYGHLHGGTSLFFDWRALALGAGLYFVWAFWIRTPADVQGAVRLFGIYMAVRVALLYALYLTGRGETLLGVPIPMFDGPAVSAIVFTALLAFRYQESSYDRVHKLLWMALAAAACLVVLLCFRRTYWGELVIGAAILMLIQDRRRMRNFVLVAAVLGIAAIILGKPFAARVESLNFLQVDSEFGADNSDHLHDLLDAWDQVRQSPLMGIGVGTAYPTWRIRNWKSESVMVHNAPLHVWLKYGAVGLISYLWFHALLLRWLYMRSKHVIPKDAAFLNVVFAYLTAQFVMTLGFAPWPYSELQLTTLISFILAAAFSCIPRPLFRTLRTEELRV
jgi:O-antigen ligase